MQKQFSRVEALGLALAFEGGILVAAVVLGWLLGRSPLTSIKLSWSTGVVGLAATSPVLLLLAWTRRSRLPRVVQLRAEIDDLLLPIFASSKPVDIAAVSLVAGIGEELLFRGVIQKGIAEMAGVGTGLAAASILFGLVHLVTPTYALLAGLVGAYLGWLFIAADNLLLPITVHSVYDFVALTFLLRRMAAKRPTERPSDVPQIDSPRGNPDNFQRYGGGSPPD